jgi:hypothetical protein
MVINPDIANIIVEIEGKEYPLAERTIDIQERLQDAEKRHHGKPLYQLWLAEMRILLGDAAVNELFRSGKNENLDRLQMIYNGVAKAFNHYSDEAEERSRDEQLRTVTSALAPVTELLRQIANIPTAKK